jgi:hypothetical protein
MTKFTNTMMIAAAVLTMAGAASAQAIKADVPFAFRAGDKLMNPGVYMISVINSAGVEVFHLRNLGDNSGMLIVPVARRDAEKAWAADGLPRLTFRCGDTKCALTEIWRGEAYGASQVLPAPKPHSEQVRVAVIVAHPAKGE